jgi:hypothetical protein
MRLLHAKTKALHELHGSKIPPYAILSHTWKDGEEVLFRDLVNGFPDDYVGSSGLLSSSTARRVVQSLKQDAKGLETKRQGYDKIRKCCEQATKDQINYIWIDTCCTIQCHHRHLCPVKRVACAARDGGRIYIAFQYKVVFISYSVTYSFENLSSDSGSRNEGPKSGPRLSSSRAASILARLCSVLHCHCSFSVRGLLWLAQAQV